MTVLDILNMGVVKRNMHRVVQYLVTILACAVTHGALAAPVVMDIRIGVQRDVTRIVFEITEAIDAHLFALDAPYRVVLDFPEVGWRLPPRPLPRANGVYEKLRYGLYKPGNSRVVIDLSQPAQIRNAVMFSPTAAHGHRLVLELMATSRAKFLATKKTGFTKVSSTPLLRAPLQSLSAPNKNIRKLPPPIRDIRRPTAKTAALQQYTRFPLAPRKPEFRPKRPRYTVVIDPGHGGVDPGTIGTTGTYEKHIALSMSRAIRQALRKFPIYRVKLTRDRDIFIPLRERIEIARDAAADLFISVHADSIKKPNIRGASVYTLSERASDKEAAALAEKENKADLIAGIDLSENSKEVTNILIDLAQRDAMNQSARFASILVGQLKQRIKLLRNTHRFAGFAVLKAPDVPSVLLEVGFLSNVRDERALKTPRYRKKIAMGVAKAVNRYFQRVEQASQN